MCLKINLGKLTNYFTYEKDDGNGSHGSLTSCDLYTINRFYLILEFKAIVHVCFVIT